MAGEQIDDQPQIDEHEKELLERKLSLTEWLTIIGVIGLILLAVIKYLKGP